MNTDLELNPLESIAELRMQLVAARRSLMVGEEAEAPRGFFLIHVPIEAALVIGLCTSGLSPGSRALWQTELGRVLLGHDCTVTVIDARAGIIVAKIPLDGAFFDFLMPDENGVAVVHELGAMGVGFDGMVHWSVSSNDIVENFCVKEGNILELDVLDAGRPVRVSLADGEELKS